MQPHRQIATLATLLMLAGAAPCVAQDAPAAPAQAETPPATREDVQAETEEAVRAVRSYSAARRQAAERQAREAVARMRDRVDRVQADWTGQRARLDAQARERSERMLDGARGRLTAAQQRSRELDAASDAEWQRARERFIESYRLLAADVQALVARSMPGRPVPGEPAPVDQKADQAGEEPPADEPPPDER
jgi:hypothetical protein